MEYTSSIYTDCSGRIKFTHKYWFLNTTAVYDKTISSQRNMSIKYDLIELKRSSLAGAMKILRIRILQRYLSNISGSIVFKIFNVIKIKRHAMANRIFEHIVLGMFRKYMKDECNIYYLNLEITF